MSNMKQILACILALALVLSAAACGQSATAAEEPTPAPEAEAAEETAAEATPAPAEEATPEPAATPEPDNGIPSITMELSDEDRQLNLIHELSESLFQPDGESTWYYTVTDLDHNGRLEFIAATQHPADLATSLYVWEVNSDKNAVSPCSIAKGSEASVPDILTDTADVYHDVETDTWYYTFYDYTVPSDTEVIADKAAVSLKDGAFDYESYAVEYTTVINGLRYVSHTDGSGIVISPEQYNAAGVNTFAGMERSSVCFEWLTAEKASDKNLLTESYVVFEGIKEPTETFPIPTPSALSAPEADSAPTVPNFLLVIRNPISANIAEGDTAYFIAAANVFDSLSWTFVNSDGGEYSVQSVAHIWPAISISGEASTTLSIANVQQSMTGWGVFCTFSYKGQTVRTNTAYFNVTAEPGPSPTPLPQGSYTGMVSEWNYGSVTIELQNSSLVTIPWNICIIEGSIFYGAPATVYWNGSSVNGCYIQGNTPSPQPVYGSMSGTISNVSDSGMNITLQNGQDVWVDRSKVGTVLGIKLDGASCVAYYTNYPSTENIYAVSITGGSPLVPDPTPEPPVNTDPNGSLIAPSGISGSTSGSFGAFGGMLN